MRVPHWLYSPGMMAAYGAVGAEALREIGGLVFDPLKSSSPILRSRARRLVYRELAQLWLQTGLCIEVINSVWKSDKDSPRKSPLEPSAAELTQTILRKYVPTLRTEFYDEYIVKDRKIALGIPEYRAFTDIMEAVKAIPRKEDEWDAVIEVMKQFNYAIHMKRLDEARLQKYVNHEKNTGWWHDIIHDTTFELEKSAASVRTVGEMLKESAAQLEVVRKRFPDLAS